MGACRWAVDWTAMERTRWQLGQTQRRGALQAGDRVQITDPKGKLHTIVLVPGGRFQSTRGSVDHDDVIGKPDGQVIRTGEGRTFQVIRPLLSDYVLSMPRGAAIVYPKDSAQIVQMGDIFPGAAVLEAGLGSGALALSLLNAIGPAGQLVSVEQREDFAAIAQANVDLWFGGRHPAWQVRVGSLEEISGDFGTSTFDRMVLDMLDPWEHLEAARRLLRPGGVLTCYVATVTQMSRLTEDLRGTGAFTEPEIWESMIRPWHAEGLAVRPEHRMVGHTGFLISARVLGADKEVHRIPRRPAKASAGKPGQWDSVNLWRLEDLGMRPQSAKKTRRLVRDLEARVNRWIPKKDSLTKENLTEESR